jgi:hypothetical protein
MMVQLKLFQLQRSLLYTSLAKCRVDKNIHVHEYSDIYKTKLGTFYYRISCSISIVIYYAICKKANQKEGVCGNRFADSLRYSSDSRKKIKKKINQCLWLRLIFRKSFRGSAQYRPMALNLDLRLLAHNLC